MIKLMLLIARKPGLTTQAFIDYYETRHVPLAHRIIPKIAAYRRNYVGSVEHTGDKAAPPDFDVITEIAFASQADYEASRVALADPKTLKLLREDELNFMDPSKTRAFLVEERS